MKQNNYTYILCCRDQSLYTGWTNHLSHRIKQHNEKKGAKYTKSRTPVYLVYSESFSTKEEAMKREAAIKTLSKKEKEELIKDKVKNEELWSNKQREQKEKQLLEKHKRIEQVNQLTDNPFLNLYHINARNTKGQPFDYYFASRNDQENLKLNTHDLTPEGIVIYGVKKGKEDQLVMIRQYRYPIDDYIYELPAGLVDKGETPREAGIREMKEETGYDLSLYESKNQSLERPFFMAQGMTDETSSSVFGWVHKKQLPQQEDSEDIKVILVTRKKAIALLKKEKLSLRAAFFLLLFIQTKENEPFSFLENEE